MSHSRPVHNAPKPHVPTSKGPSISSSSLGLTGRGSLPRITASIFGKEILPAVLIPNLGGWINGILTRSEIESWYERLRKPSWRPPNWAFGPVVLFVVLNLVVRASSQPCLIDPPWLDVVTAFCLILVWTTLYGTMGVASWMVYRLGNGFSGPARVPLLLYGSSLVLNWTWTPIFFKLHQLGWSFGHITALWVNVAACIAAFYPVSKTASWLMVPYLGWLSLATALNYRIWRDNPDAGRTDAARRS